MKSIKIVCGLLFGDEGKGSVVNHLAKQVRNPLIVRYNGGHQVGHTVVEKGLRHVFSNFGSGTLVGAPTYWSEFCTVSPMGILKEGTMLRQEGITPKLYFDANAMVVTPFDVLQNHKLEDKNNHGTVGVGFGTTIQRNEDHYHLYVRDLLYPKIRDEKLKMICEKYYGYVVPLNAKAQELVNKFISACDHVIETYEIVNGFENFKLHDLIFEGGQGIMLDMDYGFFPHVTRSNTTSKNAFELINRYKLSVGRTIETFYVTRAYQTRHGNGYMSNEGLDISYIQINPKETNTDDGFQGKFRRTVLDIDLLKYAIQCDEYHNPKSVKNLVVSCCDQVPEEIPVTIKGELQFRKPIGIGYELGICNVFITNSDKGGLHK